VSFLTEFPLLYETFLLKKRNATEKLEALTQKRMTLLSLKIERGVLQPPPLENEKKLALLETDMKLQNRELAAVTDQIDILVRKYETFTLLLNYALSVRKGDA
jgi:hypothetical protein